MWVEVASEGESAEQERSMRFSIDGRVDESVVLDAGLGSTDCMTSRMIVWCSSIGMAGCRVVVGVDSRVSFDLGGAELTASLQNVKIWLGCRGAGRWIVGFCSEHMFAILSRVVTIQLGCFFLS